MYLSTSVYYQPAFTASPSNLPRLNMSQSDCLGGGGAKNPDTPRRRCGCQWFMPSASRGKGHLHHHLANARDAGVAGLVHVRALRIRAGNSVIHRHRRRRPHHHHHHRSLSSSVVAPWQPHLKPESKWAHSHGNIHLSM